MLEEEVNDKCIGSLSTFIFSPRRLVISRKNVENLSLKEAIVMELDKHKVQIVWLPEVLTDR